MTQDTSDIRSWTRSRIGDLSGTTAMVTGANSGLGRVVAGALAESGAHVILAVRNVAAGEGAAESIARTSLGPKPVVQELDLASLASVASAAESVLKRHDSLDLLVNNAGIMAVPKGVTEDGFERQFGTNHLGHFALAGRLLPLLESSNARVVALASIAARKGVLRFDDLNHRTSYDPWTAYQQSKLANLMYAQEFARRAGASGSGITSVAAHPGVSSTGLGKNLSKGGIFQQIQSAMFSVAGQSPEDGAIPVLCAATADIPSGSYIGPSGFGEFRGKVPTLAEVPSQAEDLADAGRLWSMSEKFTDVVYNF